jgi:hypothetical protein
MGLRELNSPVLLPSSLVNSLHCRSPLCAIKSLFALRSKGSDARLIPLKNDSINVAGLKFRSVVLGFWFCCTRMPFWWQSLVRNAFFATPAIVLMPNSYSLRISSNSSTFALQSNEFLRSGSTPDQEYPFVERVGPKQTAEVGQFRIPKSRWVTAIRVAPERPSTKGSD